MKEKTSKVKMFANCAFAAIAICAMAFAGCAKEEKVLHMVTEATFPPYEFREGGKIVGIDVDIVTEAARRIGYEVEIQDMSFNSVIALSVIVASSAATSACACSLAASASSSAATCFSSSSVRASSFMSTGFT